MPRDLGALLAELERDGHFVNITQNPLAQFGRGARRLIGAELLPERRVNENAFREEAIRFRTVVANDSTRYSPVQKKKGELIASFLVELGEADIGREITSQDYDILVRELNLNGGLGAAERILDWADTTLNGGIVEHNERQRWQAIVSAQVNRRGSNGYAEDVNYSNPSGHRVNASVVWSNDANDPMDSDILPIVDMLAGKGFTVTRIIIPRPVMSILSGNAKMQARLGSVTVNVGGQLGIANQRATIEQLGRIFQANQLPAPETYDLQYRTQTGTGFFLARNVMVFCCTTGRDETIDLGDSQLILPDTLGYMAIGRAAGQSGPGRVIHTEAYTNKPPRIEGEAWETELPVIQDPEAIAVVSAIS
jgi:hypothetical protein